MQIQKIFFAPLFILSAFAADNNQTVTKTYSEQDWGIGAVYRSGTIPYTTEDSVIGSFVPMLFFENEYIFLHGTESGIKFYESDEWRLSAITRMHFVDIPQQYQNIVQGDTNDECLHLRYKMKNY